MNFNAFITDLSVLKRIFQEYIGNFITNDKPEYVEFCLKTDPSIKIGKFFLKSPNENMTELLFSFLNHNDLEHIIATICWEPNKYKYLDIMRFFIKKGIDFNTFSPSTFDGAFDNRKTILGEILLDGGLKLDRLTSGNLKNIWSVASVELVKFLLDNGATPDLKEGLYKASYQSSDTNLLKFLISLNQSEVVLNKALLSALNHAHNTPRLENITLLVKNGANIETITDSDINEFGYAKDFIKAYIIKDKESYKRQVCKCNLLNHFRPMGWHINNFDKIVDVLHQK